MSTGQRHAILIAASEFPDEPSLPNLRCPKNDVEGLAAALTSPEFGLFTDPIVFINESEAKMKRAINRVFKQAGREDQILLYYSGHGKQDKAGRLHLTATDTEADTLETSSIPISLLRQLIDNHACKQVALILDCCFGGAVGKDFLKSGVDDHLNQTFRDRGIYILTASTATQTAREKDGEQYSVFTKHILEGIQQGEADIDDDGLVSMEDLYRYVSRRVPKDAPQHPTEWKFGIQGHELVIARAVKTYNPERLRAFDEKIVSLRSYLLRNVFMQAYQVISDNQPKRDKAQFVLLEGLCEERLSVSEFSEHWLKLAIESSAGAEPGAVATGRSKEQTAQAQPAVTTPDPVPQKTNPVATAQGSVPQGFTDDLKGVKLEMIYVPGGKFMMGGDKYEDEKPRHEVSVPAFYIGKFQITQAQWKAVMGDKLKPHFKGDDNLPMESILWEDAKEFCKKLTQMTNKAYRLPTEAEWEYACRAGTTGDYAGKLDEMSNQSIDQTYTVGQYKPNAFGLYDMHGNVWEWCEDVWHDSYKGAPTDGSAWLSGGDSTCRVVRGGSWVDDLVNCRSAGRLRNALGLRGNSLGFRVVVSART